MPETFDLSHAHDLRLLNEAQYHLGFPSIETPRSQA